MKYKLALGALVVIVFLTAFAIAEAAGCTPFIVAQGGTGNCGLKTGFIPFGGTTNTSAFATSSNLFWDNSNNILSALHFLANGSSTLQNFTAINSTTTAATTTNLFSTTASSTNLFTQSFSGAGLTTCNSTNALGWAAGVFSCVAIPQGTVTSISVATANGFSGSSSGGSTPALTLSTTITGLLKGNGTAISAAAYTDFPTIAANTVLGNVTSSAAAPTALATSSQLFTGTTGQVTYFNGTNSLTGTSTVFISTASNVGVSSTTPFSGLSIGTGTASSSVTVAEYKYGAGSNAATSTASNIDCNASTQIAWPIGTSATTLTLINLTPGKKCIVVIQNPNGVAGAITWAVQSGFILKWAGGTIPTQTTTANTMDVWSFLTTAGSSTKEIIGAATLNN